MNPIVNLCMATYNRLECTARSLPNIIETASDNLEYMISVIDNGSTDGTPAYLTDLFNQKKITNLILLPQNIGVAKAHNILWKGFENTPFYAKLDNDVTFNKKNWMNDIISVLLRVESIGALGYNVEVKNTYEINQFGDVQAREKHGNIGGACFFVPKHVKDVIGFWNEQYGLYGEEDADYGYRITQTGFKNCYMVDETVMNHLDIMATSTAEAEASQQAYLTFKRQQREKNISKPNTLFWNNLKKYEFIKDTCRIDTNVLNEIKFTLLSHA